MKDNINKSAWQVTGMNAVEAAKNLANTKTGQEVPTIVKNSENSPKTTAEHIILTGTSELTDVASLPTTLMTKYASIAIINCNLQIENEEALKPAFQKLEPFVQNYSNSQDFKDKVQKIEQESHAKAEIANFNAQDWAKKLLGETSVLVDI